MEPDNAPPIDEIVAVLKQSGRWYLTIGVIIVVCGLVTVGFGMFGTPGGGSENILKYGGGLLSTGASLPFHMGWQRLERVGSLKMLRRRWAQCERTGDPHSELPQLKTFYLKVIGSGLGVKEVAAS